MDIAAQRREYEEQVRRPGKFEAAPAYAPYFWQKLEEGEDASGRVMFWIVNTEDVAFWPELEEGSLVYLYEDDRGFVSEVDGPFDDSGDDWGEDLGHVWLDGVEMYD